MYMFGRLAFSVAGTR